MAPTASPAMYVATIAPVAAAFGFPHVYKYVGEDDERKRGEPTVFEALMGDTCGDDSRITSVMSVSFGKYSGC